MTLEEKISRMSIAELKAALIKVKVAKVKGGKVEEVPQLPRMKADREKMILKGQRSIAHHYMTERTPCAHKLHRARWIPGPFEVVGSGGWWMVPTVCSECGEMVRKFVEVKG